MATRIVFLGSTKDQRLMVTVDQDAKQVGQHASDTRELSQFTRGENPIWVNLSNVLYVEEERASEPLVGAV